MSYFHPDRILELLHNKTVVTEDGCWEWIGARTRAGYGLVAKDLYAHRASYLVYVGVIPEGLEIDHLCRNRACCNWEHLEAVTHQENMRRGFWGMKTHCPRGHAYEGDNYFINKTNGGRQCRLCKNDRRRKGLVARSKTHCNNGHERVPENTKLNTYGYSICAICERDRKRAWKERQKVKVSA